MTGGNRQYRSPEHERMGDINLFHPQIPSHGGNLPDSGRLMKTLSREKLGAAVTAHLLEPFTIGETTEMHVEAIRIDAFCDLRDQSFCARVDTDSIDQQRDPDFP
jgi:hypothetical protein